MYFNRKITNIIEKWIDEKEIIVLNGPRQVGKTTILKILIEKLEKKEVDKKRIFYLNLEELNILNDLNDNPENIFKYITLKNERNYFFIDEIQLLDNPSNFLKHIYDKYGEDIKLVITGSSNLELKAKFQDSLAGRKVVFRINPLDLEESLWFQNFEYLDYLNKEEIPLNIKNEFDKKLTEYLIYGGMPAVVLQTDIDKKRKLLNEYVNAYINKDIRSIGKIENISGFNALVKIISSQIANLLNINEICNTLGLGRREVLKYLELLEHTYVVDRVIPYDANIRSQLTKMPKTYFFDLGIRNLILNNFLEPGSRTDAGALFENFVFMELKNLREKIFFYRTVNKAEIDFIVEMGSSLALVEVKYKNIKNKIDERVLKNFSIKGNKKVDRFIVNKTLNKKNNINYLDYRFVQDLK